MFQWGCFVAVLLLSGLGCCGGGCGKLWSATLLSMASGGRAHWPHYNQEACVGLLDICSMIEGLGLVQALRGLGWRRWLAMQVALSCDNCHVCPHVLRARVASGLTILSYSRMGRGRLRLSRHLCWPGVVIHFYKTPAFHHGVWILLSIFRFFPLLSAALK